MQDDTNKANLPGNYSPERDLSASGSIYPTPTTPHLLPVEETIPAPILLSREMILSRRGQTKRELVSVPGWGGYVYVKGMTGSERDSFEESLAIVGKDGTRTPTLKNFRAKLVARTIVDEQGRHLFTPADIDALGELDANDLQTVFNVAQRLSGMTAADVEEMTGNSEGGPSDGNTFA